MSEGGKPEHHARDDHVVLQAQHFIGSAELLRKVLCLACPLDDVVPYKYGSVLDLLMVVGEGRQRFNLLMIPKTLSAMKHQCKVGPKCQSDKRGGLFTNCP